MGSQLDTNHLTSALAITRDIWQKELSDALYYENATLDKIKNMSKGIDVIEGGTYLQIPVMVGGNTNTSAFSGFDTIPTATQKGFVDAKLGKKRYGVTVPVSDEELEDNMGDAKVVDLTTSRIKQATMSVFEDISTDIFLDGTGTSSKTITGLAAMVSATPAVGTYAGLNPATITAWQNKYQEGANATLIDDMDKLYYALLNGKSKPNILVSDALGSQLYAKKNRDAGGANISYVNGQKADAGFVELAYHGMPLVLDTHAPQASSTLPIFWMLNADKLGFYFKMGDFEKAGRTAGQFADTLQMAIVTQLYTNDRKAQGKFVATS